MSKDESSAVWAVVGFAHLVHDFPGTPDHPGTMSEAELSAAIRPLLMTTE
jgi:hypothetical protein